MTIDGAYTSNDPKCRRYAIERSLRTIDIANVLGTKLIVLDGQNPGRKWP